jgi:hypothetical protein
MRKNCFTQTKVVGWRHFLFVKLVSPMQAGSISSDVKIAANAAIAILIQAKSRQKYKKIMLQVAIHFTPPSNLPHLRGKVCHYGIEISYNVWNLSVYFQLLHTFFHY